MKQLRTYRAIIRKSDGCRLSPVLLKCISGEVIKSNYFYIYYNSTVDMIMEEMRYEPEKLRKENYQTTESLYIPGLNKNVAVTFSLDTYTVGSHPLPEVGQLTINAQVLKNRPAGEDVDQPSLELVVLFANRMLFSFFADLKKKY